MVLDANKLGPAAQAATAGASAAAAAGDEGTNLFVVLEEAPGLVHWEDMTGKLLADGYWG